MRIEDCLLSGFKEAIKLFLVNDAILRKLQLLYRKGGGICEAFIKVQPLTYIPAGARRDMVEPPLPANPVVSVAATTTAAAAPSPPSPPIAPASVQQSLAAEPELSPAPKHGMENDSEAQLQGADGQLTATTGGTPSLPHDLLVALAELAGPAGLANLRLVDKKFNSAVGEAGVALRPCRGITYVQLQSLCDAFSRVTSLDLSHSTMLNGASLSALKSLAPSLRSFNLSSCRLLMGFGISHMADLTGLEALSLARLSSAAILALAKPLWKLSQLKSLDLSENYTLGSAVLASVERLSGLTFLDLTLELPAAPNYLPADLDFAISALVGLCNVRLPDSMWQVMSREFLLRCLAMPKATLPTVRAAMSFLPSYPRHEIVRAVLALPAAISGLLTFLEAFHELEPRGLTTHELRIQAWIVFLFMELYMCGSEGQEGLWALVRARPAALAGIVRLLRAPEAFSYTLEVLVGFTHCTQGRTNELAHLVDAGIIPALISAVESGKQNDSALLRWRANAVVHLVEQCSHVPAAEGIVEALVGVLGIRGSYLADIFAIGALGDIMQSRPSYDSQLLRVGPRVLLQHIRPFRVSRWSSRVSRSQAAADLPDHIHRAYLGLGRFVLRSHTNYEAVLGAGGLLVMIMATDMVHRQNFLAQFEV